MKGLLHAGSIGSGSGDCMSCLFMLCEALKFIAQLTTRSRSLTHSKCAHSQGKVVRLADSPDLFECLYNVDKRLSDCSWHLGCSSRRWDQLGKTIRGAMNAKHGIHSQHSSVPIWRDSWINPYNLVSGCHFERSSTYGTHRPRLCAIYTDPVIGITIRSSRLVIKFIISRWIAHIMGH